MIEAWGRVTVKIINDCKKANALAPNFKYELSGFVVEFGYEPVDNRKIKLSKSMSTEDKILALISQNEKITIAGLVKEVNVSDVTIKRVLKKLQIEKRIERIGSDRAGIWKVSI